MNRRQFLQLGAAAGAALVIPRELTRTAHAQTAVRLSGVDYASKFTAQLPRPRRVDLRLLPRATAEAVQFQQQVLDGYPPTTLYGYGMRGGQPSWPAPTIVAQAHRRTEIQWRNKLPQGSGPLAESHLLPVDSTLHLPEGLEDGALPHVTHLHGANVESASDGQPDAWFTQDWAQTGEYFQKRTYRYDFDQRGGTLWYHDHTIGLTRLNVYAGLAGMCLLRDLREEALMLTRVLPSGPYEVELLMQDRWFKSDGQLDLNVSATIPGGVLASMFADFMLVNGKPWPVLDVEPRKYRFRLLNGSDSRFLVLQLDNAAAGFLHVGTELGLCQNARTVNRLVMGPAERYDVVIDFSSFAGQELILRNFGSDGAFRGFRNSAGVITNNPADDAWGFGPPGPANPASTGQIMKFRVSKPLRKEPAGYDRRYGWRDVSVQEGTPLGAPQPELTPTNTRGVITFNGRDDLGRGMEMQGSLNDGTCFHMDPITENPALGSTEVWEIYNTGPVVHPIHIHLVDFQVLDRQPFTFTSTPKEMTMHHGGKATGATISNVVKTGTVRGPDPHEVGPKDTVLAYPNEVTRVLAKFKKPGRYVWHCHILHHEDHDMMRPYHVGPVTTPGLCQLPGPSV